MFSWLKRIFSREKKAQPVVQPVQQPPAVIQPVKQVPIIQEEKKPVDPITGHRDRKVCQKCGAPNDDFVKTCWLCKSDI